MGYGFARHFFLIHTTCTITDLSSVFCGSNSMQPAQNVSNSILLPLFFFFASSEEVSPLSTLSPAFLRYEQIKLHGLRKPPTMTSRWRPRLRHEESAFRFTFAVISPGNLHQTPAVSVKQRRLIPHARRPLPPYSPP